MHIYNPDHQLFKVLKGYILHCTSPEGYNLICKDGYIRVNNGNLPYTWEQTKGSCVQKIGGISLLDFGLPENKIFFVTDEENFIYPWESILLAHNSLTIVIKINRKKLHNKILSWEEIKEKTEKCLLIPYSEVCSLEPISTNLFEGIVLVSSFTKFKEITTGYLIKKL
jgi:hypothetical protein